MANPYTGLPDRAFWSRAVARPLPADVDPVTTPPFRLSPADRIATAGSCFAQHISRTLVEKGFHYLVTEPGDADRNYGVFPARFGNIYTIRQLLQLFQRAYGLFAPRDRAWAGKDGTHVDPFRPQVESFDSPEALERDRSRHLAAVRTMFERLDVFIFTLGLTEGWRSKRDGAVFPVAPGVSGEPADPAEYEFVNFGVMDMVADLNAFVAKLRVVNRHAKVILTVSPVPLIATYEQRHVLVSTIYSKSALRVVAEMVCGQNANLAYFPSYEIVTGHHGRYGFFESDLRSISPKGVDHVMSLFSRHYLAHEAEMPAAMPGPPAEDRVPEPDAQAEEQLIKLYHVICDEEAVEA